MNEPGSSLSADGGLATAQRRHVRRLHVRRATQQQANAVARLLRDALRTARFPGIPAQAVVAIRRLDLGQVDLRRSFVAISQQIDEAVAALHGSAVHAASPGAVAAPMVWFAHPADCAVTMLVWRWLRDERLGAWFWPRMRPSWVAMPPEQIVPQPLLKELQTQLSPVQLVQTLLQAWPANQAPPQQQLTRLDTASVRQLLSLFVQDSRAASEPDMYLRKWWAGQGRRRQQQLLDQFADKGERGLLQFVFDVISEQAREQARRLVSGPNLAWLQQLVQGVTPASAPVEREPGPVGSSAAQGSAAAELLEAPGRGQLSEQGQNLEEQQMAPVPASAVDPDISGLAATGRDEDVALAQAAGQAAPAARNQQAGHGAPAVGWRIGHYSKWAGSTFIIAVLQQLGWPALWAECDAATQMHLSRELLDDVLALLGVPVEDPMRQWLHADSPVGDTGSDPEQAEAQRVCWSAPEAWTARVKQAHPGQEWQLQRHGGRCVMSCAGLPISWWQEAQQNTRTLTSPISVLQEAPEPLPDARRCLATLLHWLCEQQIKTVLDDPEALWQRPGCLLPSPRHLDVSFPLDDADVRLRIAGWDCDPGWVSWLGVVVHYHYVPAPDLAAAKDGAA